MLSALTEVVEGVLDVPYLAIGFLVDAINGAISGFAALATVLVGLLPGFPSAPAPPGGVLGGMLWFFPVASLAAVLATFAAMWVGFLGVKAGLKWVKLL